LFYRLNVFPLRLPPLRERLEDVPELASTFSQRYAKRIGRFVAALTPDDMHRLQRYAWPGNVRELQNVIERAVITAVGSRLNLDRALPEVAPVAGGSTSGAAVGARPIRTLREMEEMERNNLYHVLEASNGRISGDGGAAELLGMNPSTLRSRLKVLGVKLEE
jgi:transcriptional regulator with GAF, ATPase, and Fis domain